MNTASLTLPAYFWAASIVTDLIVAGYVSSLLIRGLRGRPVAAALGTVAIFGWGGLTMYLASRGLFHNATDRFPYIGVAVAAPIVIGYVSTRAIPALREAVARVSQQSLIGIQAFRLLGVLFIIALALGRLPAIFALPAGLGDILVGATAIRVAYLVAVRAPEARRAATLWNVAGVADLVIAVSIGFLASTTPLRAIYSVPSTDIVTVLPFVMVPAFAVPLFMLLHIVSLEKLTRESSNERATAAPAMGAYQATPPNRSSA